MLAFHKLNCNKNRNYRQAESIVNKNDIVQPLNLTVNCLHGLVILRSISNNDIYVKTAACLSLIHLLYTYMYIEFECTFFVNIKWIFFM